MLRPLFPVLLVLLAGCDASFSISRNPEFASAAAEQGRPGGPWSSGACSLDEPASCSTLCSKHVWDACNDGAVALELHGASALGVAGMYGLACKFGSRGACYNQARVTRGRSTVQMAEDAASEAQAKAANLAKSRSMPGQLTKEGRLISLEFDSIGESLVFRDADASMGGGWPDGAQVAKAQGALDLHCSEDALTSRAIHSPGASGVFYVEGCRRGGVYREVRRYGRESTTVPGYEGTPEWVEVRRFIDISRDDWPTSLARFDGHTASVGAAVDRDAATTLSVWANFSESASRDLACPRESVVVDIVEHSRAPSTYLAEGCGWRGLYVKNGNGELVLTSRVVFATTAP